MSDRLEHAVASACRIVRLSLKADAAFVALSHNPAVEILAADTNAEIAIASLQNLASALCSRAAADSSPLAWDDTSSVNIDSEVRSSLLRAPARSLLSIPLRTSGGMALGVIALIETQARQWLQRDREAVADTAAMLVRQLELRLTTDRHFAVQRLLDLHLDITAALSSSATREEGISRVLRLVGTHIDAEVGEFWEKSSNQELQTACLWCPPHTDLSVWTAETHSRRYLKGEGLPGLVWEKQSPEWIEDITTSSTFLRHKAALHYGVRSGMAFPVTGDHTSGVLCFLSKHTIRQDIPLEMTLMALGQQIAAFLDDKYLRDASQQRHEFLNALLDTLTDGVVACNAKGQLTFHNPAATEAHGEVISKLSPGDWANAHDLVSHSEQLFRQLSQVAPVGIFLTDSKGNCTYVNEQWSHITGIAALDASGKNWTLILDPDDNESILKDWQNALASKRLEFTSEAGCVRPDGEHYWVYVRCAPITSENNLPSGYVGTLVDITTQKEVEETMRLAKEAAEQASAAKSRFLAHMSHEVRTPLNGIMGVNAMLLASELTPRQRQLAETIEASAESLLEIVTDILDFSKIEAGHIELESIDFDLTKLLEHVTTLNAAKATEKNLKLRLQISPDTPRWINGDPARLRQVLHNLLNNAVKFSSHGEVHLDLSVEQTKPEFIRLRFVVSDEGPGIPWQARERIFEPFSQADASTTRKYGGSGLGLSICKQLVQLMHGDIGFVSDLGKGSTFWFTAEFAHTQTEIPKDTLQHQPLHLRVLLAEDNSVNRMVATHQLEELGCTVDAVDNGEEAAQAVAFGNYELVLMDCHMPVMDGYEATKYIRDREGASTHIPIIAVTANALPEERQRCLAAGMDAFVTKPFQPSDLRAAIQAARNREPVSLPVPPRMSAEAIGAKLRRWASEGMDIGLLVKMFTEEAEHLLSRMDHFASGKNFDELARAAHKLKGSAAELGDERLRRICEKIQNDAKSANSSDASRDIQLAKAEIDHMERTLKREWKFLRPDPLRDGG